MLTAFFYVELPTNRKSGAGYGIRLDDSDSDASTPQKRRRGRAKDDGTPTPNFARKPGPNRVDDDDAMPDASSNGYPFSNYFGSKKQM